MYRWRGTSSGVRQTIGIKMCLCSCMGHGGWLTWSVIHPLFLSTSQQGDHLNHLRIRWAEVYHVILFWAGFCFSDSASVPFLPLVPSDGWKVAILWSWRNERISMTWVLTVLNWLTGTGSCVSLASSICQQYISVHSRRFLCIYWHSHIPSVWSCRFWFLIRKT